MRHSLSARVALALALVPVLAGAGARAATVAATIPLPKGAGELAAGFGSIWSANFDSSTVSRIDPATNRVLATIPTHGPATGSIAIAAGAVWVTDSGDNNSRDGHTVARIDPLTDRVTGRIRVGALPEGLVVDGGSLWVANHHSGTLSVIDPAGRVSATVPVLRVPLRRASDLLLRSGPAGLAASPEAVWAGVPVFNGVARIDPGTGRVTAVVGLDPYRNGGCGGLSADAEAVFVSAGSCGDTIVRIDAHTNRVTRTVTLPVPQGGAVSDPVAAGDGGVWAVAGRTLVRLDSLGRIVSEATLPLAITSPQGLIGAAGSLWLTSADRPDLYRVQP